MLVVRGWLAALRSRVSPEHLVFPQLARRQATPTAHLTLIDSPPLFSVLFTLIGSDAVPLYINMNRAADSRARRFSLGVVSMVTSLVLVMVLVVALLSAQVL